MQLTKMQKSNLKQAKTMLENIMRENDVSYESSVQFNSPYIAIDYCKARIAWKEREVLTVLFLNNKNHLIKTEDLFLGTINQAMIYPREIVKEALLCNAAAILIAHNHPSGECRPSKSDIAITKKIEKACNLMDIRLLDHIIIGINSHYSFRESEETSQPQMVFN